jgi:hypothetical protein
MGNIPAEENFDGTFPFMPSELHSFRLNRLLSAK